MKKVFSSIDEALHIYANHPEREGRCSSISFIDGVLFSYNTAIAEHAYNEQGQEAFIVNLTSYSMTTSRQQSKLAYALNHKQKLYIRFLGFNTRGLAPKRLDNKALIDRYENEAASLLAKAGRARLKADQYRADAFNLLKELTEYFAFFGIKYDGLMRDLSELEALAIEQDNKARELAKIRKAEKIKEQAEALEKWRNGENIYNHFEVTALRIKDDEIQTTRGARIPVEHAIKAWPLLKRIHDSGIDYYANGHSIHLGHYTVTSLQNETLTVGCHKIPYSEVLNIASQLQLT